GCSIAGSKIGSTIGSMIPSEIYGMPGQGAYCPPCQPGETIEGIIEPMVEPIFEPAIEQPIEVVTPAGYQGRAVPKRELTLQEYVRP
ncbi:MAG: hypothetical protein ACKO9Q_10800, partial [Pirellula sp.]